MNIEIVYLFILHFLINVFYSMINNLWDRGFMNRFHVGSMSILLLEKLIFKFLFNSSNYIFSIAFFSWNFKKLCNCNHNNNVKYFGILCFYLVFIKQVRNIERSSSFSHNKAPESHWYSLAQLIEIYFSCLLIYVFIQLCFIIKLIT